jgi:uncharacterized protein YndB with AHSA1/START domain
MNGSLVTVDDRLALRFERRLAHPVERVWRAVTEPAEMARWFVAPVAWKPELGETFEAEGHRGEITELEPPRVLAWTWSDERYRFELEPAGDGCLLVFVHVFSERFGPPAQHAAGWEAYLDRLDAHLGGGFLSEEDAHAVVPELHARYAERFATTLLDGPALRLERRLDHPPERVWRAITEPGELAHWFPSGEELEVTESDPPRLLAGTWYGERIRIELRPVAGGCLLVFTHLFDDRDTAARTAAGWDRCLVRLSALLAGEPLGERESLAEWPEVHERLAERFGVDPELGRRSFAQHPLT